MHKLIISVATLLVLSGCIERSCNEANDANTPFNKAIAVLVKDKDDSPAFTLLENGLDVNHQNACGASFLHIATIVGNKELVDYLLQREANPNIVNWQGETPVFMAAQWSENYIITKLLASGGDPNFVVEDDTYLYNTPLLIATLNNNIDGVRILKSYGGNVGYVNSEGISVADLAEKEGFVEIQEIARNGQP